MRLSRRKTSLFTRSWSHSPRLCLFALIGLQIIALVTQLVMQAWDARFVSDYLGLSDYGIERAYGWQFFTALFLHNSIWHFAGNILVLYLVGRDLEAIIGARQFFFLYFFGAFAGELGHLFLMPPGTVLFAASGGVAAIAIAYATILPELETTTLLLFVVPLRLKIKSAAQIALLVAAGLLVWDRSGTVGHSAVMGGAAAGWVYAHLLGFGRICFVHRAWRQRRLEAERLRSMSADRFLAEKVDPLLDKIAARGLHSLTRRERALLEQAREKIS